MLRLVVPLAALALFSALGAPGGGPAMAHAQQPGGGPNVVLIIADDMTWSDIGAYGHPDVRTPSLDRLASEGLRFTHAFQAAPMCSPTRHNLYTGLYPVRSGAYPNHTFVRDGVRSIFQYLRELGYRVALGGKEHVAPPSAFPYEYLGKVDGNDVDLDGVERFVDSARGGPFFLVVASNQPHTPWDRSAGHRYDPAALTLPSVFVDTPETRRALADYYAEIGYLDAQVGRVLEILEGAGVADNTLVIFTSEQGSSFPFAKWTLYDDGIRSAIIARWPGRIAPGSTTDAMVEFTDMVPTLLEAVGGSPPPGLDGRSFLPVLLGETDAHKTHVFGIHTTRGIIDGTGTYGIRSVRSERFKYIRNLTPDSTFRNRPTSGASAEGYWPSWVAKARHDPDAAEKVRRYRHRPAEELYDVLADPDEVRNLAADPRYREEKNALARLLDEWMRQQGDLGQATELKALERQWQRR